MSGVTYPSALLLDTCAVIWLANGDVLPMSVVETIAKAAQTEDVYVSAASAWEIGMLSKPRSLGRPRLEFRPDPKLWFARFLAKPGIQTTNITPEIAIDAAYLPGDMHGDPGDRLIVATARYLSATIITRDRRIISYAQSGYVNVLPC
jgi:PIN domain nuclease of toxin-antitoxin system